ncbi:hypothetical protein A2954_06020 [Candidatus Roizmanbacteria bacterium RIFCSPLOWO2_01_FULL_37_12]|uniref:8-oxo-dGTP diphosphatase n=1 Tax=Candidatus Roizmanbacteria bacterium RIFCSPLOWO2_01_FULL_37_12 TaxID=1802056 RepID=A0A1F7ICI0_9BACT|nr:MAG: hypothetical protein A2768_01185 [Candidatus Roizmanbacteria bacterium RIFCSPHIGHO2_01_FULL_37_16]OGK26046.1 MAG: hypothetical protein A3D76_00330 [Candidatus Roizmanbacteria bacterium RIFCSPHIGHO2_02_FULL_37_9b]OGK41061.1 MAG: hypothetical protein A2954_06020 [Candidatus Roizmanbacteria bacterium RIFCSPLOWO2_01_FULL_37_12]
MYEHYLIVYCLAAFIVDEKKRILIVKKSLNEQIDAGMWVVPGGKVHQNEHVTAALKREVKEEVGLSVVSYQWIGEDVFKISNKYFHGAHFLCKVKSTIKIILEKNLKDFKWITKKEVNNYQIPRGIKKDILKSFKITA